MQGSTDGPVRRMPLRREVNGLDYLERLRCLAINDQRFAMASVEGEEETPDLDQKTLALVRLGALIAAGGAAVPSYGALSDAALDAGATVAEIVDVLISVIPVVGLPSVVAAAPQLAMALGYDTIDAL
jgi:alkylhydroperoxidase/carboxymuconolactone decarboxylase family protein YurZ